MTHLGVFFEKKSIKQSEVSRRTGISAARLSQLVNKDSTKLRATELYLIALAVDISPADIFFQVCGHLKLDN
ncbi:helix-turn-helix transcriptional regulator [Croceibacter atlanticus]|uniref:helix-turn-helix domain-containing protein n=1 Tax=Croceibacter atlanticus TaxID=313588 RepID=UPI001C6049D8|nr:helix-turn-helix transcriptional regulator [Croceibacter atlanticus]MBW4970789.1 helix-turn-helix transcriptional regulator [Croceibacter atlanticus]